MDKKIEEDVWKDVPRDSRGNFLEAPTDETGMLLASSNAELVTSYPIEDGQEVAIRETIQVTPNGAFTLYASGKPGSHVSTRLVRVPNTGGHNHGGATTNSLAVGTNHPTSFVLTGRWPQNIRLIYRAPEVCGMNRIIATFHATGNVIEKRAEVLHAGFFPISIIPGVLHLKAPTPDHPSPYWATKEFAEKLHNMAVEYSRQTGKPITVTDGTLQWGGTFDLRGNWRGPHHEHRNGGQADLRSRDMTESDKKIFRSACANAGITVLEESDHWHVKG